MSGSEVMPQQAYIAALAGFEEMTVHRLLALVRHHPPAEAFAVASGEAAPRPRGLISKVLAEPLVREAWATSARRINPEQVWQRCLSLGISVDVLGDSTYPAALAIDSLPAPVLFSRGDRSLLDGRRVAIVGTRNATAAGRHLARQFGAGLADAGVHVVSGLARGIDGQAHHGVIETIDRCAVVDGTGSTRGGTDVGACGRPIAVVASGLDVVYPREHSALWERVATDGLLLSEAPPGARPLPHQFPMRNRLVAALSEIVVVVESRERGGSLITAGLAAERSVPVMAVPGHAASRATLGVNGLLRDGAIPALDVADVLVALELDHSRVVASLADDRPRPRASDLPVLGVCLERACTIGDVAAAVGQPLVEVAMALARLEQTGWLFQADGWFQALGSPSR